MAAPLGAICKICFVLKVPERPLTPESVTGNKQEDSQVSISNGEDEDVMLREGKSNQEYVENLESASGVITCVRLGKLLKQPYSLLHQEVKLICDFLQ
ncbi:hypothetical protein P5673_029277 [Acropora cervicornis]|uniref:Uncharacterized protein n=1 Tax=Acropora cervicornis TaxID=6130 RepID=A0AAD9PWT0_ACRCE|nr:hypothetical protein P5673_029277 [Acropora cervicornis]